jgi:predicted nuclease of predicted toxin-antitoxin system
VTPFLADESLPRAVARALRAAGHDAVDARDVGLRGRPDEEVHARAVAEGRVLLSADLDFANVLRFPPASHHGVVVLRVPDDWGPKARTDRILAGVDEVGADELHGILVIVEPHRVRVFAPAPHP